MQKKSNTEIKHLAGEIYLEAAVMPGADGETELQRIKDLSCMFGGKGKTVYVNLAGFKNIYGETLAEVIEQEAAVIEALIDLQDQDQEEKAEAQATPRPKINSYGARHGR